MSTRLEHEYNGSKIEIMGDSNFVLEDPQLIAWFNVLGVLRTSANLASFTLEKGIPVDGEDFYTYIWTTKNGRAWRNNLLLKGAVARINFDVEDYFLDSEYLPSLQLRLNTLIIIRKFNITKIEATWT